MEPHASGHAYRSSRIFRHRSQQPSTWYPWKAACRHQGQRAIADESTGSGRFDFDQPRQPMRQPPFAASMTSTNPLAVPPLARMSGSERPKGAGIFDSSRRLIAKTSDAAEKNSATWRTRCLGFRDRKWTVQSGQGLLERLDPATPDMRNPFTRPVLNPLVARRNTNSPVEVCVHGSRRTQADVDLKRCGWTKNGVVRCQERSDPR